MKKPKQRPPKAYKNVPFLNSTDARTVRILCEYLEPLQRFKQQNILDTIVFFGSARTLTGAIAAKNFKAIKTKIKKSKRITEADSLKLENATIDLEMSRYYEDAVKLSFMLTKWNKSLQESNRFVVCSGGGPGIMEAANKGAALGGGKSMGLNISLPLEEFPNKYVSPELSLEFHYFFMRKLWFMNLARGMVMFPGGFGTVDETMEMLTLIQNKKTTKHLPMILYGQEYWESVINFKEMVKCRMISEEDLKIITYANSPKEAFAILKRDLTAYHARKEASTYVVSE